MGSLLGSFRVGGPFAFDYDVDVAVFTESVEDFMEAHRHGLAAHFKAHGFRTDCKPGYLFSVLPGQRVPLETDGEKWKEAQRRAIDQDPTMSRDQMWQRASGIRPSVRTGYGATRLDLHVFKIAEKIRFDKTVAIDKKYVLPCKMVRWGSAKARVPADVRKCAVAMYPEWRKWLYKDPVTGKLLPAPLDCRKAALLER